MATHEFVWFGQVVPELEGAVLEVLTMKRHKGLFLISGRARSPLGRRVLFIGQGLTVVDAAADALAYAGAMVGLGALLWWDVTQRTITR